MNLEPSTKYRVRVQLSRPGAGGEGAAGPEETMETDCPGEVTTTCTVYCRNTTIGSFWCQKKFKFVLNGKNYLGDLCLDIQYDE